MSLSVAIVGLPNVGKSTLFNALLQKQQALAANYPFATIEPNVGRVTVADSRLTQLAEVIFKQKTVRPPEIPATIEFVDIAGLVRGASQGEGLGNQFLANIRECDLICHVLRSFTDPDVIVTGQLDPLEDLQTVRIELGLKDLDTLEKQERKIKKDGDRAAEQAWKKSQEILQKGQMLNSQAWSTEEYLWLKELHLLTIKPEIYVINISEAQLSSGLIKNFHQKINVSEDSVIYISAKIESELGDLSEEERSLYLNELGLQNSGIERMAQVAYHKLDLISFLTAGEKEVRAWTVRKNSTAQQASGVIHTDFIKKFIKAKVCDFNDFVSLEGWQTAAEKGKVRVEGRNYLVQDGDVIEFMIGS